MKLAINGLIDWVRRHYDRVIAFVAVAALVFTCIFLILQFGAIRQSHAAFERWMRYLRPEHEEIASVSEEGFTLAKHALAQPSQIQTGDKRDRWFFVPESRFSCAECGHPVPVEADECPFCGELVTPPEEEDVDHDGDGMPTWWEVKHGLDPHDPSDADEDRDGDGFTNLEEYLFGTDPNDPNSHPPLIDWLIVGSVESQPFNLEFRSRVRTATGYRFGINYRLPDGQGQTAFFEVGDNIQGFEILAFEEKMVRADPTALLAVDRSELTIRSPRGDRIVLVFDDPVSHVEHKATLRMGRERPQHEFEVRVEDTFTLDGVAYRVIEIDAANRRVVLEVTADNSRYTVTPEVRPVEVVRQPEEQPQGQEETPEANGDSTEEQMINLFS